MYSSGLLDAGIREPFPPQRVLVSSQGDCDILARFSWFLCALLEQPMFWEANTILDRARPKGYREMTSPRRDDMRRTLLNLQDRGTGLKP